MLAEAHLRDGRLPAAILVFSQLLADEPALPEAWFNLAWAQRATRQFEDAATSYEHAIRHGVERPEEARLNRAVIFSDHLFDSERAKAELHAALALNPAFVLAWLNLGSIHEDLGEAAAAENAYRHALDIDPANGRAHARLGAIATFKGEASKAVPALHQALDIAETIDARADILFALGAALDDTGDYERAFQAFEAANVHARATAPMRYDPAAHETLIDRLIAAFPSAAVSIETSSADTGPVFICGMFRSGSTLAEQMLTRHPAITAGGELEFIPALSRQLASYPETVASLSDEDCARLRTLYLNERPDGDLVTDKRCDNFLHIGLILRLFPNGKIIHTVRHPLDNILSIYFQHFGDGIVYSNDLRDTTHYYIQYRRLMDHWNRVFGDRIHVLDYDILVENPEEPLRSALAYLGVSPELRRGDSERESGAVRTASTWQVRKPLHARSSGRWRNYEPHLSGIRAMLATAGL